MIEVVGSNIVVNNSIVGTVHEYIESVRIIRLGV